MISKFCSLPIKVGGSRLVCKSATECKNCIHFTNPSDAFTLKYARCKLNPIPEKGEYEFASIQRKYYCIDGAYYEHEPKALVRLMNQHGGTLAHTVDCVVFATKLTGLFFIWLLAFGLLSAHASAPALAASCGGTLRDGLFLL